MDSFTRAFVVVAAAVGICLGGNSAKGDKIPELLGHSFSTTVHDNKTAKDHSVRVQLGKEYKSGVVEFVITFTPPLPKEFEMPRRFVGKGTIIANEPFEDCHQFVNQRPKSTNPDGPPQFMVQGESFPKDVRTRFIVIIGGTSGSEFSADGGITFIVQGDLDNRLSSSGNWEK